MTRNIDEMISERENAYMYDGYETDSSEWYKITIVNKMSDLKKKFSVHPDHTLGEILENCKNDLGISDEDGTVIFENPEIKKSSVDYRMTIRDFGIGPGDELLINGDGKVAAKIS